MQHHSHHTSPMGDDHALSLEQILHTIRGVISEKSSPHTEDVLELTEMLSDDGSIISIKGAHRTKPVQRYKDFSALYTKAPYTPEPVSIPSPSVAKPAAVKPAAESGNLLSEKSAEASAKALNDLVQAASVLSKDTSNAAPSFRAGNTVEDLVIEMLKPELSAWLERNLPQLIEQLVEKEIQKILAKNKR